MSHPLRWLALVALERQFMPSFGDIAAWYAERFADAPPLTASGGTDRLLTMSVGDYTAAVTLAPRPIPWTQLEGPAATAWHWPEAADRLRRHPAHLLIAMVDDGGRPVEKAIALTRLVTAVAAAAPSVGVFWGPGRMVHAPGAFAEQALQMSADNLPLFLWIDFRIERTDDGALRLFTTGLEALGQSELETAGYAGAPQELLEHAYNIAHYLIDQRKAIRDGDTIGLTDEMQVTAHRSQSMLGGELEVLHLQFEASGAAE